MIYFYTFNKIFFQMLILYILFDVFFSGYILTFWSSEFLSLSLSDYFPLCRKRLMLYTDRHIHGHTQYNILLGSLS